jgi:hypothetical protein
MCKEIRAMACRTFFRKKRVYKPLPAGRPFSAITHQIKLSSNALDLAGSCERVKGEVTSNKALEQRSRPYNVMKGKVKVILMGLLFIIVAFVKWNMMRENGGSGVSGSLFSLFLSDTKA